ncbi:hypothetical protein CLV92_12036 [Kineococcus xinjiangensis]|uniref:Uncharacterized protein n=1 Tax=Kineococcus xinjiangensis TaxID=512762 RepID=A0A2S6ICJ8_9ACTN|nr:hypothetical protein CLV92_12036 [Kineococcus xinjiangensis]
MLPSAGRLPVSRRGINMITRRELNQTLVGRDFPLTRRSSGQVVFMTFEDALYGA